MQIDNIDVALLKYWGIKAEVEEIAIDASIPVIPRQRALEKRTEIERSASATQTGIDTLLYHAAEKKKKGEGIPITLYKAYLASIISVAPQKVCDIVQNELKHLPDRPIFVGQVQDLHDVISKALRPVEYVAIEELSEQDRAALFSSRDFTYKMRTLSELVDTYEQKGQRLTAALLIDVLNQFTDGNIPADAYRPLFNQIDQLREYGARKENGQLATVDPIEIERLYQTMRSILS